MNTRRGLEIRAATFADAPDLAELLSRAGLRIAAAGLAARMAALQGSGTVLLALEWGPPSGLVALHWYRSLASALPVAQIDLLLVGPGERRRGLGRLLVKAAAQAARVAGCGTLDVAATPDQQELVAFSQATGFTQAGRLLTRPLRKGPHPTSDPQD